jgi:hypothetical protein
VVAPLIITRPRVDVFGVGAAMDTDAAVAAVNGIPADGGAGLKPYEGWGS